MQKNYQGAALLERRNTSRYHALRGNVFFDALRHGGTTDYIAAKKIFCFYCVARHQGTQSVRRNVPTQSVGTRTSCRSKRAAPN